MHDCGFGMFWLTFFFLVLNNYSTSLRIQVCPKGRDYPITPTFLRMGLEPEKSYSREWSGFLGPGHRLNG